MSDHDDNVIEMDRTHTAALNLAVLQRIDPGACLTELGVRFLSVSIDISPPLEASSDPLNCRNCESRCDLCVQRRIEALGEA